jgi:hypothetical protein
VTEFSCSGHFKFRQVTKLKKMNDILFMGPHIRIQQYHDILREEA